MPQIWEMLYNRLLIAVGEPIVQFQEQQFVSCKLLLPSCTIALAQAGKHRDNPGLNTPSSPSCAYCTSYRINAVRFSNALLMIHRLCLLVGGG